MIIGAEHSANPLAEGLKIRASLSPGARCGSVAHGNRLPRRRLVALPLAPFQLDLGFAHDGDAFVVRVFAHRGDAIVRLREMRRAVRLDLHLAHHVDVGDEAVPAVGILEFDGGPAHDIHARLDEHEFGRAGGDAVDRGIADAEYLYGDGQRAVLGIGTERMRAPGLEAVFHGRAAFFLGLRGGDGAQ